MEEVNYAAYCATMIKELEAAGVEISGKVDQSLYRK